jgi:hypothetical protein
MSESLTLRAHHAIQVVPELEVFPLEQIASMRTSVADYVQVGDVTFSRAEYERDLLGDTPAEAAESQSRHKEALNLIKALPEDAPVKIVADERDIICGACAFAKHCDIPSGERTILPVIKDAARFMEYGDRTADNTTNLTSLELSAGALRRATVFIRQSIGTTGNLQYVLRILSATHRQTGNAFTYFDRAELDGAAEIVRGHLRND